MTLLRRVIALERIVLDSRAGVACAECRGGDGPVVIKFAGERQGPDRCPACGRQMVIRLEFDRGG